MLKRYLFFLLLITLSVLLFARTEYKTIKNNFIEKRYTDVIRDTEDPQTNQLAFSAEKEELSVIRGISQYQEGNFKKCRKSMLTFLENYGNSPYKDYALYYAALADFKNENYLSAEIGFIRLKNSSFKKIALSSAKISSVIARHFLTEEENLDLAEQIYDKEIIKELLQARNFVKILVVLPLSGKDGDRGNELLNGIKYSLNTNKLQGGKEIKLDVINSESNIETMQKKVVKQINSSRYDLIIGEMRSDRTSALAGIAAIKKIPLIAPIAANKNISEISRFIYQLNCSSYTMGQKIAEYAIDSLKYKTFATIYPMSTGGRESAAGFTDKVLEKGCEIIAREWYYEASDLTKQLTRIRERICEVDSLDVEEYMSEDSIKHVPVGVIDAFFLPISSKDLTYIPHQIAYYNFKAKLLGTYGWEDRKELAKASANVDSLIFVREGQYDLDNPAYTDMVYSYRNEYNRNPRTLELKGYDAMLLVINQIKDRGGKSILEKLAELKQFNGINGTISFADGERSNSYLEMYRYKSRKRTLNKLAIPLRPVKNPFAEAEYNYNSGYIKIVKHKNREALPLLQKAITLNPDYTAAYLALGDAYFNISVYDSALENYQKNLEIYPENADVILKVANAFLLTEDYQNAEGNFHKVIELAPNLAESYLGLALLNTRIDKEEQALKYYKIAAELGSNKAISFLKEQEKQKKAEDVENWQDNY